MTEPQTKPGEFKRLSFEQIGADDYSRLTRVRKGLLREVITPKYSIPKSIEGTRVFELVDRNDVVSSVRMRNEIADAISSYPQVLKIKNIHMAYVDNYTAIKQLAETEYLPNNGSVPPKVYQ